MCTPHHPGACLGEEAGQAEIGDHDHHPEQQGERIEVNRLCGCAETLGPKTDAASYVSPSVCLRPLGLRAGTAAAGPELFRRDYRERGGRQAQFTGQTGSTLAGDKTPLSPGQTKCIPVSKVRSQVPAPTSPPSGAVPTYLVTTVISRVLPPKAEVVSSNLAG